MLILLIMYAVESYDGGANARGANVRDFVGMRSVINNNTKQIIICIHSNMFALAYTNSVDV